MAAMNAGMEVYQTGVTTVQGVCVVHDLQLRVVHDKETSCSINTRFRRKRLAFNASLIDR